MVDPFGAVLVWLAVLLIIAVIKDDEDENIPSISIIPNKNKPS
jgi:hypothetical protein